jgi:hypothetical protein
MNATLLFPAGILKTDSELWFCTFVFSYVDYDRFWKTTDRIYVCKLHISLLYLTLKQEAGDLSILFLVFISVLYIL